MRVSSPSRVSNPSISDSEMVRYRIMEFEDRYRKQVLDMACTLVSLVDLRDAYTGGHSSRVAGYARTTAVRLGFRDSEVDSVVMAALLHDIGKISVPDQVLLKRGSLTTEEFAHIRKHPELGWMALKNIDDFKSISLTVLHHHERMDGGGYLGGPKTNEIPLGSRIIAVVDSMTRVAYILSVASMPTGPLTKGVESIEQHTLLILPRFKGAALSTSAGSGTLPWYANQPAMQLVRSELPRTRSTGPGVIIA